MNAKLVEDIANTVLYEGYMLYPYRPSSVKNRQRWNFGVLYPKAYSEKQSGSDNWFQQTECLATGSASTVLSIKVRFLQAVARTIGELRAPLDAMPIGNGKEPDFKIIETLRIGDQLLQPWQEATEREVALPPFRLAGSHPRKRSSVFAFPGGREVEPVRGADGRIAAFIVRTKEAITGQVDVAAQHVGDGLFKITVRILNTFVAGHFGSGNQSSTSRDEALMQSLLSAHTILGVDDGQFVSLLDPPASLKELVSGCSNVGTFPVLAGEEGQRDGMLSSPIILYDYPQIAPESAGDLFDGTEIDEILALRILTLTDDEKHEMRNADERVRQILDRTEAMPIEHFVKLHGVLRGLRSTDEEKQ
ncbi:MAG TPA: hypothetical protein VN881_01835 [Candidatus Acidoferrales bacterium]|nr:hypothetical protein [Candidatus Acidoferrales bacterium]